MKLKNSRLVLDGATNEVEGNTGPIIAEPISNFEA